MNSKSIIVAAALAAAGVSTFAIEAEQFVPPTSSQLSREEVRAELRDLRAAGAWEAVTEASPSPLQAAAFDVKIAQLQAASDATLALAEPAVSFEAVTIDEAQVEASTEMQQMFHHPAIVTAS